MSARTSDFIDRQAQMQAEGGKLIDCLPHLSDLVISRLKSVNNAMEQLQMRRSLMHHVDSTGLLTIFMIIIFHYRIAKQFIFTIDIP